MTAPKPSPAAEARLAALADRVDVFTEADLALLTDVAVTTLADWRKRGNGPAYVRAGSAVLYPVDAVTTWLASRVHERKPAAVKGML